MSDTSPPLHSGVSSRRFANERNFGLVFAGVFIVLAMLPFARGQGPAIWALVVAGIFLVMALAVPATLVWPNRLWLKFGDFLHRITNPLVLGSLYYGIITPLGVTLRVFRRGRWERRTDRRDDTYWIIRQPPGPKPESLKNAF
jgi:hypothetical protein